MISHFGFNFDRKSTFYLKETVSCVKGKGIYPVRIFSQHCQHGNWSQYTYYGIGRMTSLVEGSLSSFCCAIKFTFFGFHIICFGPGYDSTNILCKNNFHFSLRNLKIFCQK